MIIYSLWYAQTYKDNNIDYGYVPLPNNDDGTPSKPLGSVLGIVANKNSKYPKEADAFFKYMMKDETYRGCMRQQTEEKLRTGREIH